MQTDERQSLIKKIEALSPEARKRVEGYVDALYEMAQPSPPAEEFRPGSEGEEEGEEASPPTDSADAEEEGLDLSLRGALSHLKDEYTAEELQERANQWRIKKALDY